MRTFIFIILLSASSISLAGIPKLTPEQEKLYANFELKKETVKTLVKKTYTMFKESDKEAKLNPASVDSWKKNLEFSFNHPYIEVNTGVSKKWFDGIIKLLDALNKSYQLRDHAMLQQDKRKLAQAKAYHEKLINMLLKLLKNPVKVPADEMEKLREWKHDRDKEIEHRLRVEEKEKRRSRRERGD